MDNLLEHHAAQANNARALRGKHEQEAIRLMKELRMDHSTIRVTGASLSLCRESVPAPITWGLVDKEIGAWAASAGVPAAKADDLVKWLHAHRGVRERESLRKIADKKNK